ncbi:MAG: hypothetical protein K6E98_12530 [Lachnospiraceae bacterium]|nr:hypothetical protein [Lachnospiraceae bacterium]
MKNLNYPAIIIIFMLLFFLYALNNLSSYNSSNQKEILSEAVTRDIVHCYSIEGIYPPSLEYLEEHYGLTYDHEHFIINYEIIGSNLMPNVTIIERTPE